MKAIVRELHQLSFRLRLEARIREGLMKINNCQKARFTNYFCPANCEKKSFYKEHFNFTMVTKYNLFTVNKWFFTYLKSILYKKNLTFSYALLSKQPIFCFLRRFCLKLNKKNHKRHKALFRNDYMNKTDYNIMAVSILVLHV